MSRLFESYWFLFALAGCAFVAFCFSAWPGRLIRRTFLRRWLSPVRDNGTADVLQKLAIASRTGRPLTGAMSTLARYHFDPTLRHKLLSVRNEMEQGAEVWPSMAAAGLLTQPEERLLESAERLNNRPWVLDQLAQAKLRRTASRRERLTQLLLPPLVFAMGGLVLAQALALLVPLTEIMNSLL